MLVGRRKQQQQQKLRLQRRQQQRAQKREHEAEVMRSMHQQSRITTYVDAMRSDSHELGVSIDDLPAGMHPFTQGNENARLYQYERRHKEAFNSIERTLRKIAEYQHQSDFVAQAQRIAQAELGYKLPRSLLENSWIAPLDMGPLYSWCVFKTYCLFANEFYIEKPLSRLEDEDFQRFIESCGFHALDISPCADGRLAHMIRYVLRLPHKIVRRKSYAGAMFDVEDSLQKWIKTEFTRHHEGRPNNAGEPTQYLKAAVYHYSSSQPDVEGCAAHGSDSDKAAQGALERLKEFQQSVESSFCCGASIDLLLIGIDTDTDAIRIHIPDAILGYENSACSIDALHIFKETQSANAHEADRMISQLVAARAKQLEVKPAEGMMKLIVRLLLNNISQIDYVRRNFNGRYSDIGHNECFIGMGIGFEEVQLRNLTYFAYLRTVEQGANDLDVGIKIFTSLNIKRGLPAPVVIRYDYHGNAAGARERAMTRCKCLDRAFRSRFADQSEKGMLQTLLVIRDCNSEQGIEVIGSSVELDSIGKVH